MGIQGILKGMYDAFAADLEKDNAEEAEQEKAFRALMATKKQEEATLQATLLVQTQAEADKNKQAAESNQLRDDTQAQLKADETFFAETKDACKLKATEWASRTRLRTEELQGMHKAIEILSSPDSQATFSSSATTLLQVKSNDKESRLREGAWSRLRAVARKSGSISVAQLAADVR